MMKNNPTLNCHARLQRLRYCEKNKLIINFFCAPRRVINSLIHNLANLMTTVSLMLLFMVFQNALRVNLENKDGSRIYKTLQIYSTNLQSLSPNQLLEPDCRRLGKFSDSSSRPRPILFRFNSCNVVMDLLQKRSSFSPYVINPDLPADVRLREKVLLKERWDLIQSGTCKSDIKIKGSTLLVNGSSFGRVDQSCNFVRCDENSTFVPMSAADMETKVEYSCYQFYISQLLNPYAQQSQPSCN